MVVKEFEIFTYTVYRKIVLFFSIHTDLLYQYYFPVLWYTIVLISTVLITWHVICHAPLPNIRWNTKVSNMMTAQKREEFDPHYLQLGYNQPLLFW